MNGGARPERPGKGFPRGDPGRLPVHHGADLLVGIEGLKLLRGDPPQRRGRMAPGGGATHSLRAGGGEGGDQGFKPPLCSLKKSNNLPNHEKGHTQKVGQMRNFFPPAVA